MLLDALATAIRDLTDATQSLTHKCIVGMTWNDDALQRNLSESRDLDVRVAAEAGYDKATAVEKARHQATQPTTQRGGGRADHSISRERTRSATDGGPG